MTSRLKNSGFTLVELAIVLAIIGLLLGGLLMPLSGQQDMRARQETEKALEDIREALLGFALVNGRLPCPADPTIKSGEANAGKESTVAATAPDTGQVCANESGVLPWVDLGLRETDFWGNRHTYRVSKRFARSGLPQTEFGCVPTSNPVNSVFALCTEGDISVFNNAGGVAIASKLPAIALSHGKNGAASGAWTTAGSRNTTADTRLSVTQQNDEKENYTDNPSFVSNTAIDDQLIWIAPSILMNRMLTAGKLP